MTDWIPVSERLPEDGRWVVVKNARFEWQGLGCGEYNFAWYSHDLRKWYPRTPWTHEYVTHWMPLPPPPQEAPHD